MIRNVLLLCLLCFVVSSIAAQTELSNWRTKTLTINSDSLINLDTLTILPESVELFNGENGQKIAPLYYRVSDKELIWKTQEKGFLLPSKIDIRYRVLPFDLSKNYNHIDTSRLLDAADGTYIGFDYSPYEQQTGLLDFQGLDYNGSFARGISFGNNQNLVLNSSFNLQLAGNLGDDVEILAAITDNSIPLQPEGNTQQLQEFDKIFIQLKRRNNTLIAGDYELARPNSYFMNYYKKLQGATFRNETALSKGVLSNKVSAAIARGKFARNIIAQQEGNQGPYRLRGGDGERFIIILSGTEKVYLDGALLTRGLQNDYVIDYNRGDITFTNKRLITKDSRIIVEFEYSDQNYLRSLYAFGTEYKTDKLRLHLNVYSEQDSKNSGNANDLTESDKLFLSNIGDEVENALSSSIDTLGEFSEFRVMYKLVDTLVVGEQFDSILVYTTNRDSAKYVATFLEVGQGNGNYIQIPSAANGRVYQWIAPDPLTGELQGNFEPLTRLIAPSKRQMYSLGADYQLTKHSTLKTEVAMSNNDINLFSKKGDQDDRGVAIFTNFENEKKLGKEDQEWLLETNVNYEFVENKFQALNPYRPAEFTRDWNTNTGNQLNQNTDLRSNEHLIKGSLALRNKKLGRTSYEFGTFLKDDLYTGTKHAAQLQFNKAGFYVDAKGSLLSTESLTEESQFFRPKIDIYKVFENWNNWKIGVYGEREKNERYAVNTDSLTINSFYYDLYRVYLQSPEKNKTSFGINYTNRYDYAPVRQKFEQSSIAEELNVHGKWQQSARALLRWNMTYRELEIVDSTLINQQAQETYLGRVEYDLNLLKGAIRSNTSYEIGSGQEPKIEYQYLQVNPGEGVYQLLGDFNEDGVVQQDEIVEAAFQNQADVIRVTIVTDDFIRTNNVQFNQSLRIDPRTIWHKAEGVKKTLSKFSTQSTLKIVRRTREAEMVSPWNPFQLDVADTSLVATTSLIRNVLYFNRSNPIFDIQLGNFDNKNKVVLTTGYESRRKTESFLRTRWNLNKAFSSIFYLAQGQQLNDSEFFTNRRYTINFWKLEPELTFQPTQNFRAKTVFKYQESKNIAPENNNEKALINNIRLETTFNQNTKTSIRLNLSYALINFEGTENTPIEFAMLEGLKNGRNYIWNLTFERRLATNVLLSMSYEGRKTGEADIIHLGRAQVRATF